MRRQGNLIVSVYAPSKSFLFWFIFLLSEQNPHYLIGIVEQKENQNNSKSYVASLFRNGINKIVQKVGEEAVEVVIEAKDDNDDLFLNDCADLLFHYLILLQAKGYKLNDIVEILKGREKK